MAFARTLCAVGIAAAALCTFPPAGYAAQYPPGFEERTVVDGLNQPVAVAWTPDRRLLVAEQPGVVRLAEPGAPVAGTALDISDRVNSGGQRGLLGIAVDTDFESNRFVYLLYTRESDPSNPDSRAPMASRLGRFVLNDDGTMGPETVLLGTHDGPCGAPANTHDCIPSEGVSHSVGTVLSAPDGSLYVGSGDASAWAGVEESAFDTYDERTPRGKILRIDRDGNGLPGHPSCPLETDLTRVCTKVWASGFRNPFRFKLRANGGLTVGDVGWNTREEVDLIDPDEGGRSWGWPCYEGSLRTPDYRDRSECAAAYAAEGSGAGQVGPDFEFGRASPRTAVLGGPEYDGTTYPGAYRNRIFVGDLGAGWLRHGTVGADGRLADVTEFASGWFGLDLALAPSGNLAWVDPAGAIREIAWVGSTTTPPPALTPEPMRSAADGTPEPTPQAPAAPPVLRCVVPGLHGRTLAASRAALKRRGCRLGHVVRTRRQRTRPGTVIAQRHARGSRLARGARVAVVVSRR